MTTVHYCPARRPWARFINAVDASRRSPLWIPSFFTFFLGLGLFLGAILFRK